MDAKQLQRLRADLAAFLDDLMPDRLGNVTRRRWAEVYLRGLLLDGHRKSIEPMAERLRGHRRRRPRLRAGPAAVRQPEPLGRTGRSATAWPAVCWRPRRRRLCDRRRHRLPQAGHALGRRRPPVHAAPWARSATARSPSPSSTPPRRKSFALDAELYLPEAWGNDRDRLDAAGVPEDVGYRPKWQIALALLGRATGQRAERVVLADSAYGDVTEFRQALDDGRWPYCVGDRAARSRSLRPTPTSARCRRTVGQGRPPSRPDAVRAGAASPSVKGWALARGAGLPPGDLAGGEPRASCRAGSPPGGCGPRTG